MTYKYEFTLEGGKKQAVNLPFVLEIDSQWEKIRALTFWTKEPETLYWIGDFSSTDLTFWDIGANIGLYSLFCACVHPQSRVFAFEPQSTNFLRLMANVHINGFSNIISSQFMALSDRNGIGQFGVRDAQYGASGGQVDDVGEWAMLYELPLMTGDSFAEAMGVYPNYVKIDVDGDELKILKGMANILCSVYGILVEANDPAVIEYLEGFNLVPDKKYMALRGAGWKRSSNTNIIFTRA